MLSYEVRALFLLLHSYLWANLDEIFDSEIKHDFLVDDTIVCSAVPMEIYADCVKTAQLFYAGK